MKTINNSVGTRSNYPFKMPTHLGLPTLCFDQVGGKMRNIIYKVKNEKEKCFYVGYTSKELNYRKNQHYRNCFYQKINTKFYNFTRKYGWNSFNWEILSVYSTPEELPPAEVDWLKKQKEEFSDWNCLNLTEGGDGLINPPKEVRDKIGKSNLGKKRTIEMIQKRKDMIKNNPNYGMKNKKHKEITKQKLSKYFKENPINYWLGKKLPISARLKQSMRKKGKIPWNKGVPCSEKQKRKISVTKKGKPWTQARRDAQNKRKLK